MDEGWIRLGIELLGFFAAGIGTISTIRVELRYMKASILEIKNDLKNQADITSRLSILEARIFDLQRGRGFVRLETEWNQDGPVYPQSYMAK